MIFGGLNQNYYGALMVDPPWSFKGYTAETTPHRSAEEPYPVMSYAAMAALPVWQLGARDCVLFLWTVSSHLDQSLQLGKEWSFEYKARAFEWFKTTKDGLGTRMGMGYWTRQESETVLLFTRGSPKRLDKGVRSTIFAPIREHSRKPDEIYGQIERLVAGPYAELFATRRQPGWDSWGAECPL